MRPAAIVFPGLFRYHYPPMNRACLLLVLLALLAACGRGAPTAAPIVPAATNTAGATARPAATAAAARPSNTPPASRTAAATAAPAADTAVPLPTETPAAINPLTGLPVDDPAALERRPLAIKVAHFPRSVRDFQVGLSQADNVWEHYAEGGTTRFTAIYLGQAPERVGNVRSARLIDSHLAHAYQAMLVASGSSTGTMNRMREAGLFERVIAESTGYGGCPILCREAAATVTTDKLFTSTPALWELTTELGLNGPQDLAGYAFSDEAPAGGEPASTIRLDFHVNNTVAEWRYGEATQRYERWIDTDQMPALAPHVDTANGQALTASTVVVVIVPYMPANIREAEGGKLYYSYDVLFSGSGRALVFRDGQMYEATWERPDPQGGLPRFVDEAGSPIPFRPGVVWFDVIDPDSPMRFEEGVFYARVRVPPPPAEATATPGSG